MVEKTNIDAIEHTLAKWLRLAAFVLACYGIGVSYGAQTLFPDNAGTWMWLLAVPGLLLLLSSPLAQRLAIRLNGRQAAPASAIDKTGPPENSTAATTAPASVMSQFSLPALVDKCIGGVRKQAREKGLTLSTVLHRNVPERLVGHGESLCQAIGALLGNAVKYTKSGSVTLNIRTLEQGQGEILLRVEVSDTGCGISRQHQSSLFERPACIDPPNLPGVRQLVEAMGGQLGLSSEPEVGSAFWFTAIIQKAATVERAA